MAPVRAAVVGWDPASPPHAHAAFFAGPVIEALVARTLRLVESSQQMIRIVGLSATLPNYLDVALFLRVNPQSGLFHFGDAYRPVPLSQTFIGVSKQNVIERNTMMLEVAYDKALAALRNGKQVMVFVHARNETVRTARAMLERAKVNGHALEWLPRDDHPRLHLGSKDVQKSRSAEVKELYAGGFGVHHAGMLRADRTLTERLFADGLINLLVCTATLAWGVNLPAHTVIIKGTQLYNAEKGAFVDLGVLDVMQIFGRAGRPQFDTSGEGIIITQHAKLAHYLAMLTRERPPPDTAHRPPRCRKASPACDAQPVWVRESMHTFTQTRTQTRTQTAITQTRDHAKSRVPAPLQSATVANHCHAERLPIESQFVSMLSDHLNAEISLGTVTSVKEAVTWLSYTYLYVRMCRNPLVYGIPFDQKDTDPRLYAWRTELVRNMAQRLDQCRMVRYHAASGSLDATELGRTASHYYLGVKTIEVFDELLRPAANEADILHTLCCASEFSNIKVRGRCKRGMHLPLSVNGKRQRHTDRFPARPGGARLG